MAGDNGLAPRVPARLTPAEGRRFGLTLGLAWFALSALFAWRGTGVAVGITAALGTMLVAAGLIAPSALGPVQRTWMGLAHAISRVTTPIVMGLLYYAVFTPAGVLGRWFGHRPLEHRGRSVWFDRPETARASRLDRQF